MENSEVKNGVPGANGKTRKIHTFLTHLRPHLDEVFAWWMLAKFRSDWCRKDVRIRFWEPENGGVDAEAKLAEVLKDPGIMACGIGGGKLDEHPTTKVAGKDNDCAATLAAKEFGVAEEPELHRLLGYISSQDMKAQGTIFDIAAGIRAIYDMNLDPMVAIRWAMIAFDAFYAREAKFTVAMNEFRTKAERHEISIGDGRKITVATIESDNPTASQCSRFMGIDLLIQRTSTGNTQIYTDKRSNLPPMDDVIRVLRMVEQWKKDEVVTSDWSELAKDGKVKGAEEWFYFRKGNMILNGSLTTPNTPTLLSIEAVLRAVKMGLDPSMFQPERYNACREGLCTSKRSDQCPWYAFGLSRCRKIRYETMVNETPVKEGV